MIARYLRNRQIQRIINMTVNVKAQIGYVNHDKQFQISQLFGQMNQKVKSHHHGFTGLLINYNDKFEDNSKSYVFIEETLRRLYSHKLGFDCDEECFTEFINNLITFLQTNRLDNIQLNQMMYLMQRVNILNQNQEQQIVFLIIKQMGSNFIDNQIDIQAIECAMQIINNVYIEQDLKELLNNEINKNIKQLQQVKTENAYQLSVKLWFINQFKLDNKQSVIDRLKNELNDVYRCSTMNQNELAFITYQLTLDLDINKQENQTIINFLLEQFVEKDSMIYNHENYEYQFEGDEDQNDTLNYTFQDSLEWKSILQFITVVSHPCTAFYSFNYVQWFDEMIMRKEETDSADFINCVQIVAKLARTNYEVNKIVAMLIEMIANEILEYPDDQLFSRIEQNRLFEITSDLTELREYKEIEETGFILKRTKGFIQRNKERFSEEEQQYLRNRDIL